MKTLLVFLLLALPLFSKDRPEKTYPLHGQIAAMRTELHTRGVGVYTDSEGRVSGGGTKTRRIPVYRLQTTGMEYEIEGKRLTVGEQVSFRTEKQNIYIQAGEKEHKYRIVGQQLTESR